MLINKILAFAGYRTPVVPSRRRLHFGAWRTALQVCDADMPCVRLPGKFHSSSCCLMSTPCLPLHVASGRGYGDEIALSRADSKWLLCCATWLRIIGNSINSLVGWLTGFIFAVKWSEWLLVRLPSGTVIFICQHLAQNDQIFWKELYTYDLFPVHTVENSVYLLFNGIRSVDI